MSEEVLLSRGGEQFGPYAVEELPALIAEGRVAVDDLAWMEGMTEWQAIGTMAEFAGYFAAAPAAPAVAAVPGGSVSSATARYLAKQQKGRHPGGAASGGAAVPGGQANAGGAVASMVLGILGLTCFLCLTGIPAIILGHRALRQIKLSGGVLGGRGMAIAGLVTGYVSLAASVVVGMMLVSNLMMVSSAVGEQALRTKVTNNARQVFMAFKLYAADNEGDYPDSIQELFDEQIIDRSDFLEAPAGLDRMLAEGEPMFHYLMLGVEGADSKDGGFPILVSVVPVGEKWVVAWNDGSVEALTTERIADRAAAFRANGKGDVADAIEAMMAKAAM